MFIARNPDHLMGDGHRYQTTTEAVVIQLQTVNEIIKQSHNHCKSSEYRLYIFSVTKVTPLQWLKANNQTHSYYNDSGSYSSNYKQSINKINILEGLQENS